MPPKGSSEACGQAAASSEAHAKTRDSDRQGGVRRRPSRGSETTRAGQWRKQSRGVRGGTPGSGGVEDTALPEMGAETPGGEEGCVTVSPEYPKGLACRNLRPKVRGGKVGPPVPKGASEKCPGGSQVVLETLTGWVLGQMRR